jgi:D-alanyl-D-alanine carboxypeptidase
MPDLAASLDEVVATQLSDLVVNAVLRVELPEAGVEYETAAGTVSREDPTPARAGDAFRIASVTKTFTATTMLQLFSEGRCAPDDPATLHLDEESASILAELHQFEGRSYGPSITLRQLLTHSSGLFDYATSPRFGEALMSDPGRPWRPQDLLQGALEWGEPSFPPDGGYGYAYSDTGYVLLGLVIEKLDGRSLHESYRARILDPIEMCDTYLEGYEDHRGATLLHAFAGPVDVMPLHGSADWAGGGLVSTAADLARFGRALFGGVLIGPSELKAMQAYEFRALDPSRHSPGFVGYGFGLEARQYGDRLFRGHRGHWGVIFHVDPGSGLVITGTVDQSEVRPDELFSRAVDAVGSERGN